MDDTKTPPDQVLNFHSTPLPLAAVAELLRSHCANTYRQVAMCARYYKERALKELFPTGRTLPHLPPEQRKSVYRRAIEMAQHDAANGILRP